MASIQDIRAASSYTGDANLGGGSLGVLNISTKPIEQLAYYTMTYNKAEYDQREKDTQAKIKDLSELVAFDPNTGIKKDRDILVPKLAETIKKASEVARRVPKTHQERIDQMYELKALKDEMKNDITRGTARGTAYAARKAAIDSNDKLTVGQKEERKRRLEEEVNNKGLDEPIGATEVFDLTLPKLNATTTRTFDVVFQDGNKFITSKVTEFDYKTNRADAALTVNGWNETLVDEGTDEWNKLSPSEQSRQRELRSIVKAGGGTPMWLKMSQTMNEAMHSPDMIDPATGKPDIAKLRKNNPTLAGIFNLAEAHNKEVKRKKAAVSSGQYLDGSGNITGQLPAGASADDYEEIDYSDGLSAEEIAYLQKWTQHGGDKIDKGVQYHGAADQLQRQRESDAAAMRRTIAGKASPTATGEEGNTTDGNIIDKVNVDQFFREDGSPLNWTLKNADGTTEKVVIRDGSVQTESGKPLETGSGVYQVPVSSLDASIIDEYEKRYRGGTTDAPQGSSIKVDEKTGMATIRIDKGVITGVKNDKGAFVDRDTYNDITVKQQQAGETKYKTQTTYGIKDEKRTNRGTKVTAGGSTTRATKNVVIEGMTKSGKK